MTASAEVLGIDIAALDAARERNATLPPHWYYDPAIHEFELDEIWNHRWLLAGTLSAIPNPGDYIVANAGRVPIVVARDRDSSVRAYLNACPHRAYPLATESGSGAADGWTCLYHGWEFALDGHLVRAPGTDVDPGFDASKCELRPVAFELWGEAIFVNADINAPSLHEAHPNLNSFAAGEGLEPTFSGYEMFDSRTYDIGTNWKLFMDNFLECYHCPTVHPTSLNDGFDGSAGNWQYTAEGELFSTHFVPDSETLDNSYFYASLQAFPGFLIIQHNHFGVLCQAIPTGPAAIKYECYFYRQNGSSDEDVKKMARVWEETFIEDFVVMEVHQRNVRNSGFSGLGYVRETEYLNIHFNNVLWDAYKHALGSAGVNRHLGRQSITSRAADGVSLP